MVFLLEGAISLYSKASFVSIGFITPAAIYDTVRHNLSGHTFSRTDCAVIEVANGSRHAGAGRHPERANNTGFRVALRLPGMTRSVVATPSGRWESNTIQDLLDSRYPKGHTSSTE